MIGVRYQPPLGLPTMTLVADEGRLVLADWFFDKTTVLCNKLGKPLHIISADELLKHEFGHEQNICILVQTVKELDEYFGGTRHHFDVSMTPCGTEFQRQVWQALSQIPYGQTISYKELAQRVGRANAFRACANANGKNPISLIIPCHRVIASGGGIGGYTGGVDIKRTLLDFEQQHTPVFGDLL